MDSVEQDSKNHSPILYVNGVRRVLPHDLAHFTLLEYLRGILLYSIFVTDFHVQGGLHEPNLESHIGSHEPGVRIYIGLDNPPH